MKFTIDIEIFLILKLWGNISKLYNPEWHRAEYTVKCFIIFDPIEIDPIEIDPIDITNTAFLFTPAYL